MSISNQLSATIHEVLESEARRQLVEENRTAGKAKAIQIAGQSVHSSQLSSTAAVVVKVPRYKEGSNKPFYINLTVENGAYTDDKGVVYTEDEYINMVNEAKDNINMGKGGGVHVLMSDKSSVEDVIVSDNYKSANQTTVAHMDTENLFAPFAIVAKDMENGEHISLQQLLDDPRNPFSKDITSEQFYGKHLSGNNSPNDLKDIFVSKEELNILAAIKSELSLVVTQDDGNLTKHKQVNKTDAVHPARSQSEGVHTLAYGKFATTLDPTTNSLEYVPVVDKEPFHTDNEKLSDLSKAIPEAEYRQGLYEGLVRKLAVRNNPDVSSLAESALMLSEQNSKTLKIVSEFSNIVKKTEKGGYKTTFRTPNVVTGVNTQHDVTLDPEKSITHMDHNKRSQPIFKALYSDMVINEDLLDMEIKQHTKELMADFEAIYESEDFQKSFPVQKEQTQIKETIKKSLDPELVSHRFKQTVAKIVHGQTMSLTDISTITASLVNEIHPDSEIPVAPSVSPKIHSSEGDVITSLRIQNNTNILLDELDTNTPKYNLNVERDGLAPIYTSRSNQTHGGMNSTQKKDALIKATILSRIQEESHTTSRTTGRFVDENNAAIDELIVKRKNTTVSPNDYYAKKTNSQYSNFITDQILGVVAVHAKTEYINPMIDQVLGQTKTDDVLDDLYKDYLSFSDFKIENKDKGKENRRESTFNPMIPGLIASSALLSIDWFSELTIGDSERKLDTATKYFRDNKPKVDNLLGSIKKYTNSIKQSKGIVAKIGQSLSLRKIAGIGQGVAGLVKPAFGNLAQRVKSSISADFSYISKNKKSGSIALGLGAIAALGMSAISMAWSAVGKKEYNDDVKSRSSSDLEFITNGNIRDKSKTELTKSPTKFPQRSGRLLDIEERKKEALARKVFNNEIPISENTAPMFESYKTQANVHISNKFEGINKRDIQRPNQNNSYPDKQSIRENIIQQKNPQQQKQQKSPDDKKNEREQQWTAGVQAQNKLRLEQQISTGQGVMR